MHVWFFPFVYFIDTIFEVSEAFDVDFIVNAIGLFSLIVGFTVNSFEANVFDVIAEDL